MSLPRGICNPYIPWGRPLLLWSLETASGFTLGTFFASFKALAFPAGYNGSCIPLGRGISHTSLAAARIHMLPYIAMHGFSYHIHSSAPLLVVHCSALKTHIVCPYCHGNSQTTSICVPHFPHVGIRSYTTAWPQFSSAQPTGCMLK